MMTSPEYQLANVDRENAVQDHVILAANESYSKFSDRAASALPEWLWEGLSRPEPVKPDETFGYADLMSASRWGSLIHATVGSSGGVGGRCRNRPGLAA